jgi:acyl carrier protein
MYVAPKTEIEEQLCTIWKELLGVERVGIRDDFFDSGGHSLLALRVLSEIKKKLEVEIDIRSFYLKNDIESLASFINLQNKRKEVEISMQLDDDSIEEISW